jgi:hypothetical protein
MMTLLLGNLSHLVHKSESCFEIWELESADQVMLVDCPPLGNFLMQFLQLFSFEWRHTTPARDTVLFSERGHGMSPLNGWDVLPM